MLFTVPEVENVSKVVFPYSRFVCDAERLCEDVLERLGHGIIYTEFEGYKRGKLSAESKEFLKRLWQKHQDNLKSHLNEKQRDSGLPFIPKHQIQYRYLHRI